MSLPVESSYRVALTYWNLDTIEMFEEAKIMFLNNALKVIGIYSLSKGGISSSVVDSRYKVNSIYCIKVYFYPHYINSQSSKHKSETK